MMYKEFFQIETEHQYFSADGAADLALVPDRDTLQYLKGRHFILKSTGNGLKVLIPVDKDGIATTTFQPDEVLTFEVFPRSSTFSLFTETSDLGIGEIFRFTNEGLSAATLELVSSTSSANGSLNGFPLIGKIEIHLTDALVTGPNLTTYKVVFNAKSETWRYFFVSDKETTDLNVEDRDENLVFNQVNLDGNSSDKIGMSLRQNFPEANIFLFESATSIPCSNKVLKNLQLLRDGHVIIKHLPNPDIGDAAIRIVKI